MRVVGGLMAAACAFGGGGRMGRVRVLSQNAQRQVSAVFRVRIADHCSDGEGSARGGVGQAPDDSGAASPTTALLSIWRPPEDAYNLFAEGSRVRLRGIGSGRADDDGRRGRVAILRLASTRYTTWSVWQRGWLGEVQV